MMTKFYSVLILAAAAGMSLYADVCREIPKEAYEALCAQARKEQVTYIPIRGYKCRLVPWGEPGGTKYIALARTGDTQSEIEDGQPYLSPLVWALRDLQYYERTRTSKIRGEYIPWIEGNDTPEKARTLVFRLISENAHRCVNDTYFDTDTMSFLPVLNLAGDICKAGGGLGVIDAMLAKGADPNAPGSEKRITSLLTEAIGDGRITTVRNLIRAGADPSLEANRRLLSLILNADSPTVSPHVRAGIDELLRAQKAWDVKMSHQKLSDVLPAGTACPPEATHTAEAFAATEDSLFVTADPVHPSFSRKPVRPIALPDKVLLLERVIPSVKPEDPAVFCREKWALSEDGSELRIVRQSLRAPGGSAQCTRHIYTTKVPGVFVIGKRALVFKRNRSAFIPACTLFVRRDEQADFLRNQVIFPALRAPEGLLTEDAIDETEAVTQRKQEKLPLFSAEEEKAARRYVQACAVPLGRSDITPLSFPPLYIPVRGYMCLAMTSATKQRQQNDCVVVAHIGTSGETTEGGLPYFSPLLWALADLRDYELHRVNPSYKLPPFPNIEGNSPEKAFKIAYDLVRQNTKDCINDTVDDISVPMLALYDRTGGIMANLPASRVNLNPVLPPENPSTWRDGRFETVLSRAASLGYVNVVQVLLTPKEKTDPTLEANPMLTQVLSEANQWLDYDDDEFMRSEKGRRAVRLRACAARISDAQAAWLGRARGEKLREAFCLSSYPLKNCTLRIEEIEPFLITRCYSKPSASKATFSRTASAGCYPIRPNQLVLERIISPFGQGEKATFVRDELTLSQSGYTLTIVRHSADAPNPGDKVHSQRLVYTSSQPLIFRYGNRVLAFRRNAQGYITVCKLYTRTDDDGPFFLDRVIAPSNQSYGGELL